MITTSLRGLRGRKLRTFLTFIAVVIGVSMISGSYILTDTISSSIAGIAATANRNVSIVILNKTAESDNGRGGTVPASLLRVVRGTPGMAAVAGEIISPATIYGVGGKSLSPGGGPTLLYGVSDPRFGELKLVTGRWPGVSRPAGQPGGGVHIHGSGPPKAGVGALTRWSGGHPRSLWEPGPRCSPVLFPRSARRVRLP
jgi:hypothetical protein